MLYNDYMVCKIHGTWMPRDENGQNHCPECRQEICGDYAEYDGVGCTKLKGHLGNCQTSRASRSTDCGKGGIQCC